MKKQVISVGVITILLVSLLYSCKKSATSKPVLTPEPTKSESLQKIEKDLKLINAKYTQSGPFVKKTTKPNGWLVAGADLFAAVGAGSQTWSWCATPVGGLLAGAVIVGSAAVASALAWNIAPPPGNHINQATAIVQNVGTYVVPNPYGNPYESNGAVHNEKVKILVQKPFPYTINYSTLAFDSSELTVNELDAFSIDSIHISYKIASFITANNVLNNAGELNFSAIIDEYCGVNTTLSTVSYLFLDAFEQINDDSTAMALINDYENYFINTQTNITDAEKAGLLNGFAVGKYSLAMWADALNN